MTTLPYAYLAKNISFSEITRKDFKRIGNKFKEFHDANHSEYPFFELGLTEEGYSELYGNEYESKDALFDALDKVCYIEKGSARENIVTRKILIGIYQNIEHLMEPDEKFGTSYYINIYDPLWSGIQEPDGFYIHCKNNIWFINKSDAEDIIRSEEDDDDEFWDYVSNTRASSEDTDLKQYYLERNNL